MKKFLTIKKSIAALAFVAFVAGPAAFSLIALPSTAHAATTTPNWNATGSYVVDMQFNGTDNPHDMTLVQDSSGNLTGNGGSPAGANTYTWVVTSGSVSGDAITLSANYTATADAVTPQTVLNLTGTIASDGTLSGTWSDNYQGGARTGAFSTTSGAAVALTAASSLAAQDFGVMNQSGVKGYTAGFGLTSGTFAGATSVVTKLYSGATLLQTDTAIMPKFNANITGTQFSSPFDVFGTFDYAADGYWTNVRGSEYGQTLIPTSVVATATLSDGSIVTATNSTLTGDPATIFPTPTISANVITNPASAITPTDATLNGTNGKSDASGHLFWVSLAPFVTTSATMPAGVYATPDLGAISANTAFSASLSSVVGLPAIAINNRYYVAAWSNVGGTWYPGAVENFATGLTGTVSGVLTGGSATVGTLEVTSITPVNSTATADGTFANGWKYVFDITLPTNESHLFMKFGNWTNTTGSGIIAAANNIRISSPQADNSGQTILMTAADSYATPDLHMITDLDPSTDGIQTQVTVETAVPLNSLNGTYTASYGAKTI